MQKIVVSSIITVGVIVFLFFIFDQMESDSTVNLYDEIIDYQVTTKDQRLVLTLKTQSPIPENIHDVITESNIGFGYAWLWDDSEILEHHGGGHLKGYVANIHTGDPLDQWHMETVSVAIVFDDIYDIDFCFTTIEDLGTITIGDNTLEAKTPLKYSDVYDKPLENLFSFDLVNHNLCHSGFGGKIINNFDIES